jgi:hypothetical protein
MSSVRSVISPVSLRPSSLYSALTLTFSEAVALALFVYDYTLTIGDEMQYIWRRPVTGVKVLYLILRYGVAIAVLVYFQGESLLESVCTKLSIHIAHIAISGLATHLSHNVCILLVCTPQY